MEVLNLGGFLLKVRPYHVEEESMTITLNRHHRYPVSQGPTGQTVHTPAYVAATDDGQVSVPALCGAATFGSARTDAAALELPHCGACEALQ